MKNKSHSNTNELASDSTHQIENNEIGEDSLHSNSMVLDIEKEIYRSSLKQVVNFLNTTLPPLENDSVEKPVKIKKKEKKIENETLENSYLLKSVTPTRQMSDFKVKDTNETVKKRINTFSERKYKDTKMNRKLHKTKAKKH